MVRRILIQLSTVALIACSGGGGGVEPKPDQTPDAAPESSYNLEIPVATYKWNPDAGDKSVSAEQGGPGFTGEGWESNFEVHAAGDPNALKGGSITLYMPDWPATVRQTGKDWNTYFNYFVTSASFQPLLGLDPVTLELVPSLATHWQVSDDKKTYRFRINPEARWSDGTEVTSNDVVASWKLRTDPKILDPSGNVYWGRYEEPKAISKYIVEVTVKEDNWRNLIGFATGAVLPAHEISIPGDEYLDKFQFAFTSVTGPYMVKPEDIKTGESITLSRRDDYWGKDNPVNAGTANIDTIKWVVVKSPDLAYEKAKKGELDFYPVPKAQWWAEEVPSLPGVEQGYLRPLKIFNDEPIGTSGMAINLKRAPLDDVRIRRALQLLHPTERLIETLYYDEYEPLTSYWQGGMYANPGNKRFEYDPAGAVALLEEAGWTEKNDEGYRVKDGRELSLNLQYASQLSERGLTVYQEELKDAGIRLNLELLTPAARWQNLREKEFDLSASAWGAIIFPNPESSWHSKYADQKDNNNVVSYANPRVDELIAKYDAEYDIQQRAKIIQEIDGIIYNDHPYVLEHYLASKRLLVANKFGFPEWGAPRFVDEYDAMLVWWVDPELDAKQKAARKDPSVKLDRGPSEIRFWEAWHANASKAPAPAPAPAGEGE